MLPLNGQIRKPLGGENTSLFFANAGIENSWSGFHNPATLPFIEDKWRIGIAASNYYFLKDLNQFSVASQFKVGKGKIHLGFATFGMQSYSENILNLAYGIQLFKGFSIGIGCNYIFHIVGSEKDLFQAVSPTIGLKYKYKSRFSLSFFVDNPVGINWIRSSEKVPITFGSSFEFFFQDSFRALIGFGKTLNTDFKVQLAFEYSYKKMLYARIGFSLLPLGFSAGIGYQTKYLNFNFGMLFISNLGPISSFDFSYAK